MLKAFVFYLPTHRCFMKCGHCFYSKTKLEKKKELDFDIIFNKLSESKYFHDTSTFAISGGEPFVRDGMAQFILNCLTNIDPSVIKEHTPQIHITTTGWYVEEIKMLVNSLQGSSLAHHLRIIVSVDGIGKQHDEIRGIKGAYERAMESIHIIKSNKDISLQTNTVIQNKNLYNLVEIKTFLKPLNADNHFIPLLPLPGKSFPYSKDEIINFFPLLDNNIFRAYVANEGRHLIQNCHAGETSISIDPDGIIFPCDQIAQIDDWPERAEYIMGTLTESSLDEIYESEQSQSVRLKIKSCLGCWAHCNVNREVGCHGMDISYSRPFTADSNGTRSLTIFHSKGIVPNGRSYGYTNMIRAFGIQLPKKGVQIKSDSPRTLHIGCPESFHPSEGGTESLQLLFTMFESDKWPSGYVKHCNYFKKIIVPCEHNAKALKNSGCEAQIAVCPLGYDNELIKYERKVYIWGKNFRILWLGAPHVRKGHEVLAKAFQTAFKPYESVELYLKTTAAEGMPPVLFNPYPKVFFDNRNLPFDKIIELYHSAHVFAFPTRGEGFGLPPLEAMAAGCLVIAPAIQGLVQFVNKDTAWPLEWSMKPTPPEVIEVRIAPLVDWRHLAKLLRKAYENYETTLPWRERGAAFAATNYTWKHSADKLIEIIYGGN